jgi:hypothetical protein
VKGKSYWQLKLGQALVEKSGLEAAVHLSPGFRPRKLPQKLKKVQQRIEYIEARLRALQPTVWKRLLNDDPQL